MFVNLFYNKVPFDILKHILSFIGNEDLLEQIKSTDFKNFNNEYAFNICSVKFSQIKLPIFDNRYKDNENNKEYSKYFNYISTNRIFQFITPFIKFFPFDIYNSNIEYEQILNLTIGLNKMNNISHSKFSGIIKSIDTDANHTLLRFMTKFEEHVYISIVKLNNSSKKSSKKFIDSFVNFIPSNFSPILKSVPIYDNSNNKSNIKKFAIANTDLDFENKTPNEDNIIGYYYKIRVFFTQKTKFYKIRISLDGIKFSSELKNANIKEIINLAKNKKIMYTLAPIIKTHEYTKKIIVVFEIKKIHILE